MPNLRTLALTFLAGVLVSVAARAQVVAYHNQTTAQHQSQFNALSAQGYRMVSLSIYDDPLNPLFAAVWVHRTGPAWLAFHNVDTTAYQNLFNTWAPQGYMPKLLSATGSGSSIRFAGVFERETLPFFAGHNLSTSQFDAQNTSARDQGFRLVMATVYGSATTPQFAGVWRRNDENISWSYAHSADATTYQQHFVASTAAWLRPIHVTLSSYGRYLSIWNDNQLQSGWSASHNLTAASYQTAFNSNTTAGRYPICVQAGGVGSATRFAAVFAASESVAGRTFTVTGTAVPALAAFDSYVQQLMQGDAVRGASLAVVKDGRLVLARGYTWAESGYPITQPSSLFRIASASKPLTSIAVHQHMARSRAGIVNDDRRMLSFFPSIVPLDARTNNITLLHLLTHRGGWNIGTPGLGFDPLFHDEQINAHFGGTLPVTKADIYQYMTTQENLQFTPGNFPDVYSNYGFMMLGRVLESLETGLTYEQIVQRDVFAPLGVTRARIGGSLLSQAASGEVRYHPVTPYIARSAMSSTTTWVPGQYGDWNQGNLDANGGWIMATADYAKVLASFSLGNQNPLMNSNWADHMWSRVSSSYSSLLRGWWYTGVISDGVTKALRHHNGGLPGTATLCCLREDGVGFCLFLNRDHWLGGSPNGVDLSALADQVTTWPNHDLFPSLGIPSIRTHVTGTSSAFGTGCAGNSGTPSHTGSGTPETGQTMTLRVGGAGSGVPVVALVGFSSSSWLGSSLPLPLAGLGAPTCSLLVAPDVTFSATASAAGAAALSLRLPEDPSLIGVHLYSQFAVAAPGANGLGLAFSSGLDTAIGGWH